jgi:hypothetical protein
MCRASLPETVTEQSATAVLLATTKAEKNNEIHLFGIHREAGKFEGMTEDERNAIFDECFEYNDHLRANGHLVAEYLFSLLRRR